MSETMVEKVARAILEAMDITDGLDGSAAKTYAIAAIEAMREPTVGMYKAFDAEKDTGAPFNNGYRAMISAALHDPEGGEA